MSLDHRWIAELAVRHPPFEARLRRALSVSRERLAWVSGVKQELLDFFVRQGISVSGEMVRVRRSTFVSTASCAKRRARSATVRAG